MKKLVAVSFLVFFASLLPASAKTSTGHMTVTEVEVSCINHSGTVTAGSGKGGYGCNYPDGNKTSCTAKGNCTFTSPNTRKGITNNNVRANSAVAGALQKSGSSAPSGPTISKSNALMNKPPVATGSQMHP